MAGCTPLRRHAAPLSRREGSEMYLPSSGGPGRQFPKLGGVSPPTARQPAANRPPTGRTVKRLARQLGAAVAHCAALCRPGRSVVGLHLQQPAAGVPTITSGDWAPHAADCLQGYGTTKTAVCIHVGGLMYKAI